MAHLGLNATGITSTIRYVDGECEKQSEVGGRVGANQFQDLWKSLSCIAVSGH